MSEKVITIEERARRAVNESTNALAQSRAYKLRELLGGIGYTGQLEIKLEHDRAYFEADGFRFVLAGPVGPVGDYLAIEYFEGYTPRQTGPFKNLNGLHFAIISARTNERPPNRWEKIKALFTEWWNG